MNEYTLGPVGPDHFAELHDIECEAESLFPLVDLPLSMRGAVLTDEAALSTAFTEGLLWGAWTLGGTLVGFAHLRRLGANLHLDELDVLPAHQRRGLGARLVAAARDCAKRRDLRWLTLTTFRFVPWNMPWYRKLGFIELQRSEFSLELTELFDRETARGLPRERRVAMALDVTG